MSLPSRLHAPLYSSPAPLALRHQHSPTANRGGCACTLHVQPLLKTLHRTPYPRAPYTSDWCRTCRGAKSLAHKNRMTLQPSDI